MGLSPDVPPAMAAAIQQPEDYDRMGADYDQFPRVPASNATNGAT